MKPGLSSEVGKPKVHHPIRAAADHSSGRI